LSKYSLQPTGSRAGSYTPQQFLYQVRGLTAGQHTLELVKTGGTYVQVDAFQIWP
jgi:hypothetical protein